MSRQRGWVSVSVQTYQSHRTSAQRILQQEYTVDESGATLNALSRSSENAEEEPEQQNSTTPTTSIFIRDWKVRRSRVPSCKRPPKALHPADPGQSLPRSATRCGAPTHRERREHACCVPAALPRFRAPTHALQMATEGVPRATPDLP